MQSSTYKPLSRPLFIYAKKSAFKRPVVATSAPVEQLTFRWEGTSDTAGQLVMEWENTQLTIPVERR